MPQGKGTYGTKVGRPPKQKSSGLTEVVSEDFRAA